MAPIVVSGIQVVIAGLTGFVLHETPELWKNQTGDKWRVSCSDTGFLVGSGMTCMQAVESAETRLADAAKSKGVSVSEFLKWSKQKANEILEERTRGAVTQ